MMNGKDLRLVSFCNSNKTVLNGFNSQVCCGLDFIRVTDRTISDERGKKGSYLLHPGKFFEMRFDFIVRSTLKNQCIR